MDPQWKSNGLQQWTDNPMNQWVGYDESTIVIYTALKKSYHWIAEKTIYYWVSRQKRNRK